MPLHQPSPVHNTAVLLSFCPPTLPPRVAATIDGCVSCFVAYFPNCGAPIAIEGEPANSGGIIKGDKRQGVDMKQGLWQCGQCRQWWIYKVEPHTERLNRECLRCGKRVRATIDRRPGRRGRPATVRVEQRPSYMPHTALEHERQARNKHWRRRPAVDEFTRASKLEEWEGVE